MRRVRHLKAGGEEIPGNSLDYEATRLVAAINEWL